jgi:hypothetical protein
MAHLWIPRYVSAMGMLQEIDEIFKIFRILGTPNDSMWPKVKDLPDFKDNFPQWAPRPLEEVCSPLP